MSDTVIQPHKQKTEFGRNIYFLAGILTASVILGIVGVVGYKIGFSKIGVRLGITSKSEVVEIPRDVLDELIAQRVVIENVPNLTPQAPHDTVLVQPDSDLEYRLRPNVRLDVTVLNSKGDINLDPPLLHVPTEAQLSEKSKDYIRRNSRVAFTYSTDESGHRLTLPAVKAENKILVVGDSVAFGVGVSDGDTAASNLQKLLGDQVEVVNGGVGGYAGEQAFRMAELLTRKQKYSALIYIACQNDFGPDGWSTILEPFKTISDRVDNRVIVLLHTYMEYNLRDVLLERGWPESQIRKTTELRAYLKEYSKSQGFRFADWTEIVNDYRTSQKSVFAPFALYVDHCHLSAAGNRLMAEKIAGLLHDQK